MNPLTNVKNVIKMNDRELEMGIAGTKSSWHNDYRDSAWVFLGGMPYDLTEGDLLAVFSQYGEIVHINLVRDHDTGKSKGFGFLCYEDQRSTILAVDNINGFKLLGRTLRVDHVQTYKLPKDLEKMDQDRKKLFLEGCAPKPIQQEEASSSSSSSEEERKKVKKKKKKEKKKKKKKEKRKSDSEEEEEEEKREDSRRGEGRERGDRRPRSRSHDRSEGRKRGEKEEDRARRRKSRSQSRSRDRGRSRKSRSRSRDRSRDRRRRPSPPHSRRSRSRSRDRRRGRDSDRS